MHIPTVLRSALILCFFLTSSLPIHAASTAPYTAKDIITATNRARDTRDLHLLTPNPILTRAAQEKANRMVKSHFFNHTEPDGTTYFARIFNAGYRFSAAGENLARNYGSTRTLMRSWLGSAAHRSNILNPQYTNVGVGMAYGTYKGETGWFVVEFFGKPYPKGSVSLR